VKHGLLSDITSQALQVALRGTAARQEALADNIANIDTPGFTRTTVAFEQSLRAAIAAARRGGGRTGDAVESTLIQREKDYASPRRVDGNNVSIEREMTALARNALAHQAVGELLAGRIRGLRAVIRGNRG